MSILTALKDEGAAKRAKENKLESKYRRGKIDRAEECGCELGCVEVRKARASGMGEGGGADGDDRYHGWWGWQGGAEEQANMTTTEQNPENKTGLKQKN